MLMEIFDVDHPEVAQTRGNVANFLVERMRRSGQVTSEQLAEANELAEQALAANRAIEHDHPFIGDNLKTLGEIAKLEGDVDRASSLLDEAMDAFRIRLQPDHLNVVSTRVSLGECWVLGGDIERAEEVLLGAQADLIRDPTKAGLKEHEKVLVQLIPVCSEREARR